MPTPLPTALAPGLSDHVCHAYDRSEELRGQARHHLLAGIALEQRPLVLAPARDIALAREIAADAVTAADGAAVVDVVELAVATGPAAVDAGSTLQALDAALAQALAEGHAGLRIQALLTHVAVSPFLRTSWGGWEQAFGPWQSVRPVASACSFDRAVLGDKAVQELACLHPRSLGRGPVVPFRLFHRDGRLVLEGEVDSFSAPLLAQAARHVDAAPGERLMIDARGLAFLNHRGLWALVEGLAERSGGVTLLGGPSLVTRMCTGLGIAEDVLDVLPWPW
jgi:hypothetical protein